jgi:hypothetical protein
MTDIDTTKIFTQALMQLARRADKADPKRLVETFVDAGPLFTLLSIHDNQIVYGRRGTGKTHALQYLSETVKNKSDIACFSDLSNLGSSGGIYSDQNIPLSERASRLLVDTLLDIHQRLFEAFVENAEEFNLAGTGPLLDELAEAVTQVKVVGSAETCRDTKEGTVARRKDNYGATLALDNPSGEARHAKEEEASVEITAREKLVGEFRHTVHFGSVRRVFEKIAQVISPHRLWIVLDEWSSVPMDLQPYLADLIRRSLFPVRDITVKIAAIEYRSRFQLRPQAGDYIGIEVGADASTDVNLDDFMVFDNDESRAREFFKCLFHKHLGASDIVINAGLEHLSSDEMIASAFTQITAFDELVKSAEGVARDAIHIASLAAQYAASTNISVPHVRRAAKTWYQTGKEAAVHSRAMAMSLLHWIVDKVIGDRRARAFMLRSNTRHPLIEDLFDARVLHVLKRGISTHDEPGARYDAYKLDYGCYVDLFATTRAPRGLYPVDTEDDPSGFVDVPGDDYRSIRRAILNIEEFEKVSVL